MKKKITAKPLSDSRLHNILYNGDKLRVYAVDLIEEMIEPDHVRYTWTFATRNFTVYAIMMAHQDYGNGIFSYLRPTAVYDAAHDYGSKGTIHFVRDLPKYLKDGKLEVDRQKFLEHVDAAGGRPHTPDEAKTVADAIQAESILSTPKSDDTATTRKRRRLGKKYGKKGGRPPKVEAQLMHRAVATMRERMLNLKSGRGRAIKTDVAKGVVKDLALSCGISNLIKAYNKRYKRGGKN